MRFEVKFAYPPHFDDHVRVWIRSHAAAFGQAYPPRRIHNVYFDTHDLRALVDNLAGISRRGKMRYRWYGEAPLPQAGTLEFKNKHTALGWKDSFSIDEAPYRTGDGWRDIQRNLRAALPLAARLTFDEHGEAALINTYWRRYFVSRDGRLRVTLDSEQEMFDQLHSSTPNVTRRMNLPAVHILELKCDESHRDAAVRALASCPIRGSRFSKYTVGSWLR